MNRLLPRALLAPAVATLFLWMIVPLAMTLYFSAVRYNLMQPGPKDFIGLANYEFFDTDPDFLAGGCRQARVGWRSARTPRFPLAGVPFMGDDLIDLPVMMRCGLAIAPANARPVVRERAHALTDSAGGHGAVREAAEFILAAQGKLDHLLAAYLDPP